MFDKLKSVEKRYDDLNQLLSDPKIISQQSEFQKYAREQSELSPIVHKFQSWQKIDRQLEENKQILNEEQDPELIEMAREDVAELESQKQETVEALKLLLLPKDPRDERNVIVEIRAGTGGEEAALFSNDLFRMYSRYAEEKKWQVDILSSNLTGKGGFKEVIFNISGKGVYSKLKYEGGTHRVQRVPDTESQGRIHTSAVTVAVMPEVEDVDIKISPADVKVDVYRSSGPGGQSVNTTDSAVRLTYIPTGMIVTCQDEKSQHKNREKAMKVLRARLYDEEQRKQQESMANDRKQQVGSGDRSERIRTYNFPQERVTDHRIGLTLHKLSFMMEGDLNELLEALTLHFQTLALKGE
ncbi:MAG: peptide chain release factor 1 [Nitrospina sp.]|jgi:peptide chain release factor 1|nr:peptide chain release factor 1 [Nitrospina sp.]MBT3510975.1 peptide chain release factor 1 [Nitrospina sp.]MBT3875435.1 peptide chain release factor 1 [Nitrospina sp.]MBT4048835.1 peptide chain release factor 1 [Nitrospina sp.]MBT4558483.1 peptide chain release factor 1 [Nitrospina sp.]